MEKVIVYRWSSYDGEHDMMRQSRRWATQEASEKIGKGVVDQSTAVEIDASLVGREVPGMTEIGFDPHVREPGFQRTVGGHLRDA